MPCLDASRCHWHLGLQGRRRWWLLPLPQSWYLCWRISIDIYTDVIPSIFPFPRCYIAVKRGQGIVQCTVQSPDSSIHMRDFTWAPCGSYSECPGETTSRTLRFCQKTESVSAETICSQNHLRWLGHVTRMSDERLPKQFLIGELFQGSRTVGGQRKRFKDQASGVLRSCHISPGQLEALTSDRRKWCSACKKGLQLK